MKLRLFLVLVMTSVALAEDGVGAGSPPIQSPDPADQGFIDRIAHGAMDLREAVPPPGEDPLQRGSTPVPVVHVVRTLRVSIPPGTKIGEQELGQGGESALTLKIPVGPGHPPAADILVESGKGTGDAWALATRELPADDARKRWADAIRTDADVLWALEERSRARLIALKTRAAADPADRASDVFTRLMKLIYEPYVFVIEPRLLTLPGQEPEGLGPGFHGFPVIVLEPGAQARRRGRARRPRWREPAR
jgi:hypothetical protein